jgi:hypothetical protein
MACSVMADGQPYADLSINIMAGNYGPDKMETFLRVRSKHSMGKIGCSQQLIMMVMILRLPLEVAAAHYGFKVQVEMG